MTIIQNEFVVDAMPIDEDDPMARDEEMARALQEQFRQEEEEEAARASVVSSTAPAAGVSSSSRSQEVDDAAVARSLVNDELRAASAFETSAVYSPSGDGNLDMDDAEVAMRMEQEARDAAFAASLQQQEQQQVVRGSRSPIAEHPVQDEATRRRSRRRSRMNTCLVIVLAVAVSFILFRFVFRRGTTTGGGGGGGGFGNPFDDLADWFSWEGDDITKGEDIPWGFPVATRNNGLDLQVLNNLDEKWQSTFATVMDEWDNGTPDSVSFRIERISDNNRCRTVEGAMVICNANYGRTSWRGINELVTLNGRIISSVAKLNDYFLEGRGNALRQYVCCHEVGHGLGLGHTDERQYNADLGECMDYTVNPDANMHPGRTNFEALAKMYGGVNTSQGVRGLLEKDRHVMPMQQHDLQSSAEEYNDIPDDIEWRVLRRTEHSEHHEADLGDGRKVRRVLLLV